MGYGVPSQGNGGEEEDSNARLCPLRRLEYEPLSAVLPEFTKRLGDMPPEHKMLMQKFQQDENARKELDAKFGDDKEKMLASLWKTHRHMFRDLHKSQEDLAQGIEAWLEMVTSEAGKLTEET